MMQLVLSLLLMYAAVGAAAIWYRRQTSDSKRVTAGANNRTEGTN